MVYLDTGNNTDTDHIVSILCLGMGPEDNYFLALVTDQGPKLEFVVKVRHFISVFFSIGGMHILITSKPKANIANHPVLLKDSKRFRFAGRV